MKNFPRLPWFTEEGATIQFRAEFFNAFNHTQFRSLDTNFEIDSVSIDPSTGELVNFRLTNDNFGKVERMRDAREIQFGLKIIW